LLHFSDKSQITEEYPNRWVKLFFLEKP
jgi:hypothetical protein